MISSNARAEPQAWREIIQRFVAREAGRIRAALRFHGPVFFFLGTILRDLRLISRRQRRGRRSGGLEDGEREHERAYCHHDGFELRARHRFALSERENRVGLCRLRWNVDVFSFEGSIGHREVR